MRLPPESQGFWWPQAELLRWLAPVHGPEKRYGFLCTGYGGGKTLAGAWAAVALARHCAPFPFLVAASSFGAAKHTTYASVIRCLAQAGMKRAKKSRRGWYSEMEYWDSWGGDERSVSFGAGARLVWFSSEAPDTLRGFPACGAWLDEPSSQPEQGTRSETWFGMIDARVREGPAMRVILTDTPDLNSWTYGQFIEKPPDNCRVITCSSRFSPYLPPDYVPNLIATYGERKARAIVDGEWVDLKSGQVYEEFRRPLHVAPTIYQSGQRVILAWDFNRNPMHVLGCHLAGGSLAVFREWIIPETTTEAAARAILASLQALGHTAGIAVVGDASGSAVSRVGGRSDWDCVRPVFSGASTGGYTEGYKLGANEAVAARVARVNAAFRHGRVTIDPSCKTLIRDLVQVVYRKGTTSIDAHKHELTHASDALGYALWWAIPSLSPASKAA